MNNESQSQTLATNEMPQESARAHEEEIITFHDQGHQMADAALPLMEDLHQSYLDMAIAPDTEHTIYRFLQRPVKIWSGKFSSTDTVRTQKWVAAFPDILIENAMYREKLSGFVGLRADLEIKVQINAQKFQQGRLRLVYIPYKKYLTDFRVNSVKASLQGLTSCPGVDIDICGGSTPESRIAEGILHIPYVSPHLYYNLVKDWGTFGEASLWVYSPLLSGAASDCEITIWARFIDPKLAFPTAAPIAISAPTRMKAEVRGEAKQIQQSGVISNTLGTVADALHIAGKIPVIGEYVAIPEWLSRRGADIAKLFGFAKPTTTLDTKLRTTNCMANYNGKDSSHKMALSADNEIDTPSGIAGTNLDEMAISSIVTIPAYWDTFSWPTTSVAETVLWTIPVTPNLVKAYGMSSLQVTTPLGYVAQTFGLWRGSIVYTFKMVKTGFHAGRLRVFYVPYVDPASIVVGAVSTLEIEKNYQVVVDISENDTFSFTVPFVATKPWLVLDTITGVTGNIVVTVLNELRAPDVCAQNINVLVEINGGKDMTFAIPKAPNVLPALSSTAGRMKAQVAGTGVSTGRENSQLLVDPETIHQGSIMDNWTPESHCIGEKFASLRQLLKRNNYIGRIFCRGSTNQNQQELGIIAPYNFGGSLNFVDSEPSDYLSYYSFLYVFFRGSMRLKVQSDRDDGISTTTAQRRGFNTLWFKFLPAPNQISEQIREKLRVINTYVGKIINNNYFSGGVGNYVPFPLKLGQPSLLYDASPAIVSNTVVEGMHEMEVPYYNSSHISVVTHTTQGNLLDPVVGVQLDDLVNPLGYVIFGDTSPSLDGDYVQNSVYRSVGDDFSFHYLIGVPLMLPISAVDTEYTFPSQN